MSKAIYFPPLDSQPVLKHQIDKRNRPSESPNNLIIRDHNLRIVPEAL